MEVIGLESFLKEKRKSKTKRRSSFANEAFKLINMNGSQNDDVDPRKIIEALIDSQYEWIEEQIVHLKNRIKHSKYFSSKTNSSLKQFDDDQLNKMVEKRKDYESLSKEHRVYLETHNNNINQMKENEKLAENQKFSYLNKTNCKRISRRSSLVCMKMATTENKLDTDPIGIALRFLSQLNEE